VKVVKWLALRALWFVRVWVFGECPGCGEELTKVAVIIDSKRWAWCVECYAEFKRERHGCRKN